MKNAPKLDRRWRLAALLHDAPEYVIGDMITPLNMPLGDYRDIDRGRKPFTSVSACRRHCLKASAGHQACRPHGGVVEATQLAGFSEADAAKILKRPRGTPTNLKLRPVQPEQAAEMFLKRFRLLGGDGK